MTLVCDCVRDGRNAGAMKVWNNISIFRRPDHENDSSFLARYGYMLIMRLDVARLTAPLVLPMSSTGDRLHLAQLRTIQTHAH